DSGSRSAIELSFATALLLGLRHSFRRGDTMLGRIPTQAAKGLVAVALWAMGVEAALAQNDRAQPLFNLPAPLVAPGNQPPAPGMPAVLPPPDSVRPATPVLPPPPPFLPPAPAVESAPPSSPPAAPVIPDPSATPNPNPPPTVDPPA